MGKPTWKVWIKTSQQPPNIHGWTDSSPLGSMLDWDDSWLQNGRGYEAREPFEFTDTLTIDAFYRGRSAAGIRLHGSKGEEYMIRISELTKLLKAGTIIKGTVTARWGFKKQGANYSLTYLGDE